MPITHWNFLTVTLFDDIDCYIPILLWDCENVYGEYYYSKSTIFIML